MYSRLCSGTGPLRDHNEDHLEIHLDNFGEERFRCFARTGFPALGCALHLLPRLSYAACARLGSCLTMARQDGSFPSRTPLKHFARRQPSAPDDVGRRQQRVHPPLWTVQPVAPSLERSIERLSLSLCVSLFCFVTFERIQHHEYRQDNPGTGRG